MNMDNISWWGNVDGKVAEILLKITNKVYNLYGPSETTIWSTSKKLENCNDISIGNPISNTKCVILNSNRQPVPKDVLGIIILLVALVLQLAI